MKVSYKWLKELVDFNAPPDKVADMLTLAGLEVETIDYLGKGPEKVVVGVVKKRDEHPRAKKLWVCQVDVGNKTLQIVCGAQNVKTGAKVPVALIGAQLPSQIKIDKARLKGVDSLGMICSEMELGIGEESKGIMILDDDLKVGEPLSAALDLEDYVLNLDLTPNRPDCLSMIGVAREVAALLGGRIKKPKIKLSEILENAKKRVEIKIDDPDACPRYAARVMENVQVDKSPFWLRRRLQSVGLRAINNVVDITNMVMMEQGHPLHAFDFDLFSQPQVLVRRAKANERFTTLDQVERKLNSEVLLITDGKKPVAIAGIMGGLKSEVTEKTENVLLESAYFNPRVIRRGRVYLGINSDASYRFERGADPNNVVNAANRAAQLIVELTKGKALKGVVDCYPQKIKEPKIKLRQKRVNQILGTQLTKSRITSILKSLEMKVKENKDWVKVQVPTFRPDITREIDLIEEIVRIHGYDKIDTSLRAGGSLITNVAFEDRIMKRIKEILVGDGFFEVVTNNLVDPKKMEKICSEFMLLKLRNPLSEELSVLRTSLIYNILRVVEWNKKRKESQIRIFELGLIYPPPKKDLSQEKYKLCLALSGIGEPVRWDEQGKEVDFYDLKGAVESLLEEFSISGLKLVPYESSLFLSNHGFKVKVRDLNLGILGEISPEVLDDFDLKDSVFLCELDFERLLELIPKFKLFSTLPKFPPVERDIAVVVGEEVLIQDIEEEIKKTGGELIEKVVLFDLYRGGQVPPGKKSLAYSLRYRRKDRTLTDQEVEKVHQNIISQLKDRFNAKLRD
jgi:phenylalanyl-tRNA synthetase beta chain